jgi:hypothetical protein
MRPVDLEELLGSEAPGEDDDEDDCVTVDECRARNPEVFENVDVPGLDLVGDGCWSDHAGSFPAAVLSSVQGCQDPELEPEP